MASIQNFFIRAFLKVVVRRTQMVKTPIEEVRANLEKLMAMVKLPGNVSFEKTDCGGIPGEWALPNNMNNNGAILYLHGGAYISGSIDTHRPLVARIARTAATRALTIEYRYAPEHPFPAGLDDAIKAYHWLLGQGFDHRKIIIAGDSAGGGLTLATLIRLRDEKAPMPAAVVCMSPWLDLTCSQDSGKRLASKDLMLTVASGKRFAGYYAGGHDLKDPYISPFFADLKNLSPMLIQVSDSEILIDENVAFEKKAKAAGVDIQLEVWGDMNHVWQGYAPILPEAKDAIKVIGRYIQKKLK